MMRTPIPFKVTLVMKSSDDATMHRFHGSFDFEQISDTLHQIAVSNYPSRMEGWHVGFDYTDPDGDRIRVASELEWRECVQLYAEANPGATKPLRLNAFRTHKARKPMPTAMANLLEHSAHTPILRTTTPLPILNAENLDKHVRFAAGTNAGDGETTSVRHNSRMSSPLTPPLSASHLDANPMHPPLESQPDSISVKSAGSINQREEQYSRPIRGMSFSQEDARVTEEELAEADSYSESFIEIDEPECIEDLPRRVDAPPKPQLALREPAPQATAAPAPAPAAPFPAATIEEPAPGAVDPDLMAAISASIAESLASSEKIEEQKTREEPSSAAPTAVHQDPAASQQQHVRGQRVYRPWNNANDNSHVLIEMFPDVPRKTIKGMLKHNRNDIHVVMEMLLRGERK